MAIWFTIHDILATNHDILATIYDILATDICTDIGVKC